jgi:F-type H+-transporting ATPase subunit epsilon
MQIFLEIVTPDRLSFQGHVDSVNLPATDGEIGILPHHIPLITTLGVGELRYRQGDLYESYAIGGGFVEVRADSHVIVMAEDADLAAEIDVEKALAARRAAEERIAAGFVEPADLAAARAQLQHSLLKIRVAERRHREGPRRRM